MLSLLEFASLLTDILQHVYNKMFWQYVFL